MIKKYRKQIIIGLITGVLNGLFGSGGGSVSVPAMEKFLKIDEKKSHATAIAVILPMSVISSGIYLYRGFFDFRIWLMVSLGGIVGGFTGAKLLGKIPKKWLKIGFGAVISIAAVRMFFRVS